jgi:hypothetical protein
LGANSAAEQMAAMVQSMKIHSDKKISDGLERFRKRFPGKTDKELLELKQFLERHLEIALDIYEEMKKDSSFDKLPESS